MPDFGMCFLRFVCLLLRLRLRLLNYRMFAVILSRPKNVLEDQEIRIWPFFCSFLGFGRFSGEVRGSVWASEMPNLKKKCFLVRLLRTKNPFKLQNTTENPYGEMALKNTLWVGFWDLADFRGGCVGLCGFCPCPRPRPRPRPRAPAPAPAPVKNRNCLRLF